MRLFGRYLEMLLMANAITAKEVSDVFTSLKSIAKSSDYRSNTQYPFDWYNVELGWSIDTEKVATGDTFILNMPYVYEVRILKDGELRNYFDITSNGNSIASCDIDPAGGRSLETTITCKVTADLSQYSSLAGTVDFVVVFDNGGRKETIDSANQWVIGSNTVTFNDKLSSQVSFRAIDTTTNQFLSRITMRGDTFYYYAAPCNMCQGRTISSGSFVFEILDDGYQLKEADTETYVTNSLNSFGFPGAVQDLEIFSKILQNGNQRITVNFGTIGSDSRFWFSTFSDKIDTLYREYTVKSTLSVRCSGGGFDFDSHTTTLSPVRGCAVGVGSGNSKPVTVTTTKTRSQCTESTKFITGSDSTVTEIVEMPNSSLCAASSLTTSWSSEVTKKTTSCSTNSNPQTSVHKNSKNCSSTSHASLPKTTACSTLSFKTFVPPEGFSSTESSSCFISSFSGSAYSIKTSSVNNPSSSVQSIRSTFYTELTSSVEASSSPAELSSSGKGSSTISEIPSTELSYSITASIKSSITSSMTSSFSIQSSSTRSLFSSDVSFIESTSSNEIPNSSEISIHTELSSSSSVKPSSSVTSSSSGVISSIGSTVHSDTTLSSEISSFSELTISSEIKSSIEKSSSTEASSSIECSSSAEISSIKITSTIESSITEISSAKPSSCSEPSCLVSSGRSSSIMASSSSAISSSSPGLALSSEATSITIFTRSPVYQFSSGYWNSSNTLSLHSTISAVFTQPTPDTVNSLIVSTSSSTIISSPSGIVISSSLEGSSSMSSNSELSTAKISSPYVPPSSSVTTTILNPHSTIAIVLSPSSTAPPGNVHISSNGSSLKLSTISIDSNSDEPKGNSVNPSHLGYVTVTTITQKDSTVTLTTTIKTYSSIDITSRKQLRPSETAVEHVNETTTSTHVTTNRNVASSSGSGTENSGIIGTPSKSPSTTYVTSLSSASSSLSSSSSAVTILEGLGSMTHLSGLITLVALFINTIFI